jgi:hypothetical protein
MPESFKLSKEHEIVRSLMKCPMCNQFPIVPNYIQSNGIQISRNVAIANMDISTIAECSRCKQRWSVFSDFQSETSVSPSPTNIEYSTAKSERILEISNFQLIETNIWDEPLGSERRIIDNSKGTGCVTRKLIISKEWSKTYTVNFEKAVKASVTAGFKLLNIVDIKASIEGNLRKTYSISESIKNTYTDEFAVEVKPQTKVTYCINWKCIWQNGVIKCLDWNEREVASIPFQVVIGVTFDILSE